MECYLSFVKEDVFKGMALLEENIHNLNGESQSPECQVNTC